MIIPPLTPQQELFLGNLESGELRSANLNSSGVWETNIKVKEGILDLFRAGILVSAPSPWIGQTDKHTVMPRSFDAASGVRVVPGGSTVRRGAFIGDKVIVLPPSYINIGAYVGAGTMVDSHVLVGTCAQIGSGVHLSAGVQVGGVLEPIGMDPVIIEDGAFIGAGSVIVEGRLIKKGAVLAPMVSLSRGVAVFDLVHQKKLPDNAPIPENAVVIPGTREIGKIDNKLISANCAIIIKYRDQKTSASLVLEEVLR